MCRLARSVIVVSMTLVPPLVPGSPPAAVPIGPDTFLLHQVHEVHGARRWVCANSMVIAGAEPVIVTTGRVADSGAWLHGVFGVVEPTDVRWVYLSLDDLACADNLAGLMTACPEAVLVASQRALRRHAGILAFPVERCRFVDDGESFEAGDRRLLSVRTPAWSVPGTRGLLDQRTGIYWAADAFGCLLPDAAVTSVAEVDHEVWADGMALFAQHLLAPWLDLVDHRRFAALCDRTQALGMSTIASAHSPLITDMSIDEAFQLLRDLPASSAVTWPAQRLLDTVVSPAEATTHEATANGRDR
jgi:flavorubredoxin